MRLEKTLAKVVAVMNSICDTGHGHCESEHLAAYFRSEGFHVVAETIGGTADTMIKVYCIMEEYENDRIRTD